MVSAQKEEKITKSTIMQTKIKPELIATGEPQKIIADLQPFDKAKEQVALTVAELNKYLAVSDDNQKAEAMEVLSIASKVEKAIEKKRKELVEPFNDGAKAINAHAKEITTGLPAAIDGVKRALLTYQKAEEERALELKKQARIKQLEEMGLVFDELLDCYGTPQKALISTAGLAYSDGAWDELIEVVSKDLQEQEAQKLEALKEEDPELYELIGGDEPVVEAATTLPAPSTKYFEPAALKGVAKVWKFEITNSSVVPREFLIVDETAIRRAIAAGTREIAGVRIYQEDQLRVR